MADPNRPMALDPYQPCPCGSGKKFKWCCQPVHVQIDKAFRQDAEGQHDTALRLMDEVCAEHSGNPEVWGRKAQLLYQMDRVEDAETALQKAFDINPNYPFGTYLRGRFRHFEGEIPGALMMFRKAAELYDPAAYTILAPIYALIAECEWKLNRPIAARAALTMAAKLDPGNETYRTGIEQVFGQGSTYPEVARKEYTYLQLPADAPPERRAAWDRALKTADTAKLTEAVAAFEQQTVQDPACAEAWYNFALTKAWLGDNAGAIAALEHYLPLQNDEEVAGRAWGLAEVLLCGHGQVDQADFVENTVTFPIRNPELLVKVLQDLQQRRRLIGVTVRQEDGILSGMLVEKVPALTADLAASQLARLGAYLMVIGDMLRMWNGNKEMLDAMAAELRQTAGPALGEPLVRVEPTHFADVLAEGYAFPLQGKDEAEEKRRMDEHFERFMEETWIHRPLRSLRMTPPVDAVGHTTLRKRLRGIILFLSDCNAIVGMKYDFDRLRRKLGLVPGAAADAKTAARDFTAMGAPELAAVDAAALSDAELDAAHQSAAKLGAQELAGNFARALLARPPSADKPDRYPLINELVQQALAEQHNDEALDLINKGEKADSEHNEGRRRNDYDLRRGQIYIKRGEPDQAAEVFERLIERAPGELRYRGSAAEAMLSAKKPAKALAFAEGGLKMSRQQNNRDSEQYFLELAAAARKQGA